MNWDGIKAEQALNAQQTQQTGQNEQVQQPWQALNTCSKHSSKWDTRSAYKAGTT